MANARGEPALGRHPDSGGGSRVHLLSASGSRLLPAWPPSAFAKRVSLMTAPSPLGPSPELFKRDDNNGVVTLTLNTPHNLNALSLAMIEALIAEFEAIASDDECAGRGAGRALARRSAPATTSRKCRRTGTTADRGHCYYVDLFARCSALMQAIVALPKPVIAAVEGVATAAGCQLVAACDLAIAGERARFGLSGVNFGLFCSTPLVAVGRAISRKRAMEMAMTGRLYSAAEAERFGLVNRVVPEGHALEEAQALAKTIAQQSGPTLAIGKRAFYAQIEQPLDEAYSVASLAMIDNLAEPRLRRGHERVPRKAPADLGARPRRVKSCESQPRGEILDPNKSQ